MPRVLLLGGTGEARALAEALSATPRFEVVSSLAGRVDDPKLPAGEVRIGGFGGPDGLADWMRRTAVDVVVDATHPFAATMTAHAAAAAATCGTPIVHLRRPGWVETPGDRWIRVPSTLDAAARVDELGARVFLTIGRQGVGAFADLTRPWFLIRSIEAPRPPLPPHREMLPARGPFSLDEERELLARWRIDVVVTKDSGGDATAAKLTAAREAGLPVVMIDRPPLPATAAVVNSPAETLAWLRGR